jgi:bifunctional UDP-N-acetylglucosamine pyrophosphorylase/glucosamine-1-phosphate N-acetyltransferase
MQLRVVILAAGKGKRMGSPLPKVLHRLAGKTLLEHVVATASQFDYRRLPIIVHGYQGQLIRDRLAHLHVQWVEQAEQRGTGHALQQAAPHLSDASHVLVLYGDIPLTSAKTLQDFIANTSSDALGIITARLADPMGFGGRIIRDNQNKVINVIEEKEATAAELDIKEVNSGFYIIPTKYLSSWLTEIKNNNAQHEYYLTDIIPIAAQANVSIQATHPLCTEETLGINDPEQLARLERFHQINLSHAE